jgi:hypothetical protein
MENYFKSWQQGAITRFEVIFKRDFATKITDNPILKNRISAEKPRGPELSSSSFKVVLSFRFLVLVALNEPRLFPLAATSRNDSFFFAFKPNREHNRLYHLLSPLSPFPIILLTK